MSQTPNPLPVYRRISLSILTLISIGALALGVIMLLFALLVPSQSSDLDRQATNYLGGLYYLFMSWTLFGIAAGLRWFVRREERGDNPSP